MKRFFIFLFIFSISSYAQNQRDIFIKDSVLTILNSSDIEKKAAYDTVLKNIKKLDKRYGYQVNLHRRLLEASYGHKNISLFKEDISILVKHHGFDVAYMSGYENYYNAIMHGKLAVWFKEMYLENHTFWLSNNFDKQISLRKLNTIHEKDQFITSFAMRVLNLPSIDSLEQENIKKILSDYYQRNIDPLLETMSYNDALPNEQNFAVLQKGYDTALIHNFQFKDNLDKNWAILFPYYKKAYLNNEITDVMFRNYDFYCYQHHGYQEFDSFTIEQIPEQFRKDNTPIKLKDREWLEGIKKEFNWTE